MSNFVNGEVGISESAEVVSIALGGIFDEGGMNRISKVKLDKAGLKKYKRTEEGKCLKQLLAYTSSMELEIDRSLRSETVLRYKLGKLGWFSPLFLMLIIESIIMVGVGMFTAFVTEIPFIGWIVCGVAAFLAAYAVLLQLIVRGRLEKNFHKIFLPRLDRYIDIVKKHKDQA